MEAQNFSQAKHLCMVLSELENRYKMNPFQISYLLLVRIGFL